MTSLGSELNLAKGEGQRNEVALEEAGRSRAELARDKAALVVQLTASERENTVLSEELAAFRCLFSLFNDTCASHIMPVCVCVTCSYNSSGQSGSPWKPVYLKCSSNWFRWSLAESSWRRRTKPYECAVKLQQVSKKDGRRRQHAEAKKVLVQEDQRNKTEERLLKS